MKRFGIYTIIAAFAVFSVGCATDEYGNRRPMTDAEKGALIGAASGAVVGALVKKDKRAKGALIGAVGGGLAGAAVGTYMDSQKKDLEKVLAPEVQAGVINVAKTGQNNLLITMTAQTAFDFDSAAIKPGFHSTMDKIANVLVRYGKTHLTVVGHTDNVGTQQYNQSLSERRAGAVADYLGAKGVIPQRLASVGQGENSPRATNATEEGRRLNRRVEIVVEPIVAEPQG
ncbi:flagellar motor protein MotB [Sulfuricaulis limicola]|uniref:Flagellar motor protein MotB n=1 Tax=Sulfuricaulis limicola TaxID=1620215 RepID=A0A1B4XJ94_9GAMM|nr:OmpA family protein [Sulfuricaulis limicola]BAV34876.1 flagellar motor protein MotB [Sulfuricaulis limicola]